jgi:hypothetical protein
MRSAVLDLASQPVRNLVPNPRCTVNATGWNGAGSNGTRTNTRVASGGPSDDAFFRIAWTAGATISTASTPDFAQIGSPSWGGQTLGAVTPVTPGRPYFLSIMVRPSRPMTLCIQAQGIIGNGPGPIASTNGNASDTSGRGPATLCPANVWTLLSVWAVPGATTAAIRMDVDMLNDGTGTYTTNPGDTLDLARAMLVEGVTSAVYADGDTPGWRWTGAAGASVSVGYPYTLESVAGAPLAVNTVPNSTVNYAAPAATSGRTLYVVHDTTDTTPTGTFAFGGCGATSLTPSSIGVTGSMVYRHNGANIANRGQSMSGSALAAGTGALTPESLGRHVGVGWMIEGDLGFGAMIDGRGDATVSQAASGGMPTGTSNLCLAGASAPGVGVVAYLFAGQHDRTTRLRVSAWLARRYGSAIPAGY